MKEVKLRRWSKEEKLLHETFLLPHLTTLEIDFSKKDSLSLFMYTILKKKKEKTSIQREMVM